MFSRRVFMKNGGLALLSLGFAPAFLARTVEAAGSPRRKVLITIFQRGAVDGLNMVVPFGEKDYYAARPSIAVPRPNAADGAVDLDGFFGLHPRLSPLKPLWDSRQLAIVHASGSPDGTRSHFDAQDYMESGTPGVKSTQDGWLNRYLHAREHANATPFRAVALAPQLPRSLQGLEPALAHQPDRPVRHPRRPGDRHGAGLVRVGIRGRRRQGAQPHRRPGVRRGEDAEVGRSRRSISPRTARSIRGPRTAKRCVRSRSSSRRTSASRSRSRKPAAGTRTSTRVPRPASSRSASTTSARASPRSRATSAIAWRTSSS